MKKLKAWQIILLIIFYPVGIVYLIYRICKKNKSGSSAQKFDLSTAQILRDFHTKVVGVSFNNADGSSRQEAIKSFRSGEDVLLKPLPTKDYPDAIGVFSKAGKQIGYLNADLAHDMKYKYPTNPMSCAISDIHGGEDGKNLGVTLHVVVYKQQDKK